MVKSFNRILVVLMLGCLSPQGAALGQGARLGGPRIVAGPYLMQCSQTSMTVMWETAGEGTSEVEYGLELPLEMSAEKDGDAAIHEVAVTGLEPETSYFYRVCSSRGSGKSCGKTYSFKTAVKRESAYAFVVLGDNRTFPSRFKKIAELAYAERPDFVVHVGDVVTNGEIKSQWKREFFDPAAPLMRHVPTYIAIGNHERDADWFYDYVSYPEPENFYSFDYGNAHFTIVDSNDKPTKDSAQYKWIERDLAGSNATWKFVAHHHPPYSSDSDDYGDTSKEVSDLGDIKRRRLVPLYEKYDVDIVWVGHIHSYERTWPIREGRVDEENGVIYIQTGGGGAPLEEFAPTRSWFTAKVLSNYQYCLVTVHGGTLRVMAYDINGRLYDYLELNK
jgi:predicted phosphodiesterase